MPLALSKRLGLLILGALLLPAAAGAAPMLRVGSIPIAGNVALYCAMDYGGLAAEGIEIQSTDFQSGTRIVEALAGGSLDIGLSATLSVLQAVQQVLDLVIVAPASFIAAEYLSRGGVSPRDVTWQELSYPHIVPALDTARVDAAFVAEPFLSILRSGERVTVLSNALDIIPGSSTASYTALRSWTQSQPAVLEAFLRGLRRGIDVCERDPQKMRDALVKHTGVKPALAQQIGLPVLRPTLRAVDLLPLVELARRHGLLVRDVDIERLLSPGTTR